MKPKLIIVTGNQMKFEELSLGLSDYFDCEQKNFENYFEIQGTPEEILLHKLKEAQKVFGGTVLVDDTSVHFDELKGFPGPYFKDFAKYFASTNEIGKKFAGTRMQVVCHIGLYDGVSEPLMAYGEVSGDVVVPKEGDAGAREFDIFMIADGTDKPMIEFSYEEKNQFSHRGNAMRDLIDKLNEK